jgi:hypothetical protein
MPENTQPPSFNFMAAPDLKPEYANLVRIAHSPLEFTLEFARLLPGEVNPVIVARMVMSPLAIKMLKAALGENLSRFENTFGEINPPGANTLASQLFRPNPEPEPPKE